MSGYKKTIAFVLLISFFVHLPFQVLAASPAELPPIPVSDTAIRSKEVGITVFGVTLYGLTLDSIAMVVLKRVIESIMESTTEWVRSGFEGNPAYATDPKQFFLNVADYTAGEFIEGSDLNFLCSPFRTQIRLALASQYSNPRQFQCSLTEVVGNIEAFYDDFEQGGWDAWFSMTQKSANNPYGAYLDAKIELDSRVAEAVGLQDKQLEWNSGFFSWSPCIAHKDTIVGRKPNPEDPDCPPIPDIRQGECVLR